MLNRLITITSISTERAIINALFISDYFAFFPYKTASTNGFMALHHKLGITLSRTPEVN